MVEHCIRWRAQDALDEKPKPQTLNPTHYCRGWWRAQGVLDEQPQQGREWARRESTSAIRCGYDRPVVSHESNPKP